MQKKKIIKTHKITLDLEEIDVIKAIECGFKIDRIPGEAAVEAGTSLRDSAGRGGCSTSGR